MKKILLLIIAILPCTPLFSMEKKRKRAITEQANQQEAASKYAKTEEVSWKSLPAEIKELIFHWAIVQDTYDVLRNISNFTLIDRESHDIVCGNTFFQNIVQQWALDREWFRQHNLSLYGIFCRACRYGKEPFFSMLKNARVLLNHPFILSFSTSALYHALEGNQKNCAEQLILAGAEVPSEALDLCCDDLQLNELILRESTMQFEETSTVLDRNLLTAILLGQDERAMHLLKQGASSSAHDARGFSALMFACMTNNRKIVEILLSQSIDCEWQNENGQTALFLAVKKGFYAIAEFLLAHGADVNTQSRFNPFNSFPIDVASENNNTEMIKLLVKYGAQLNYDDGQASSTPLSMAVSHNNKKLIEFLLAHDVKVNTILDDGNTALHFACNEDDIELVRLLLTHGADVDRKNDIKETPLFNAIGTGSYDVVELLIAQHACVNIQSENGLTPLKQAIRDADKKIVKLLLENKADPNAQDADGDTALMEAAATGNRKIARILLKHGANKNSANNNGETALDIARKNNHYDCANVIETYMSVSDMITGNMISYQ